MDPSCYNEYLFRYRTCIRFPLCDYIVQLPSLPIQRGTGILQLPFGRQTEFGAPTRRYSSWQENVTFLLPVIARPFASVSVAHSIATDETYLQLIKEEAELEAAITYRHMTFDFRSIVRSFGTSWKTNLEVCSLLCNRVRLQIQPSNQTQRRDRRQVQRVSRIQWL